MGATDSAIAALVQAKEAVNQAVAELRQKVAGVPDMAQVVRMSKKPSVFTISSKAITNSCWDPFFYDFSRQGEYVSELIDRACFGEGKAALDGILGKGTVIVRSGFNSHRLRFHPDFVAAVRPELEDAIRLVDAFGGSSAKK